MSEQRDRERDGSVPAPRDADTPAPSSDRTPARSANGSAPSPAHPAYSPHAPAPEFLSLTYTLPYHLVARAHEIAQDSYRSQSEVVADALRLYLRTWKARRTHARVSTVEGFAYQEVAIAEALIEAEESGGHAPEPSTEAPPVEAPPRRAPSRADAGGEPSPSPATDEENRPPATFEQEPGGAERDSAESGTEVDDRPSEAAKVAGDSEPDGGTAPPAHGGADGEDEAVDSEPARAAAEPAAAPTLSEPAEAEADVVASTSATPSAEDAEETPEPVPTETAVEEAPDAAASVDVTAPETTDTASVEEPAVTVATEVAAGGEPEAQPAESEPEKRTRPRPADGDAELHEIADPAAAVRLELEAVAGEPLHSLRLQRTLEKIASRIDAKDHSPDDHSATVAEMARKLGRLRGLKGRELQHIQLAGLTHDIGKASIPDHILTKRRPNPEEMGMIRKYPEFGAELLRIVPSLEPIVPLVASHQERWNGNGYPDGLQGGDIPVAAQIVALCDVYQVLINDRHYRPAYTEERARQIIRQNVGTLWNPDIARTFLKMINGEEPDEE